MTHPTTITLILLTFVLCFICQDPSPYFLRYIGGSLTGYGGKAKYQKLQCGSTTAFVNEEMYCLNSGVVTKIDKEGVLQYVATIPVRGAPSSYYITSSSIIYFDMDNYKLRKYLLSSGQVTNLVQSMEYTPYGFFMIPIVENNSEEEFFYTYNNCIYRRFENGTVILIAGNGAFGMGLDYIVATETSFRQIINMCYDANWNMLYVIDRVVGSEGYSVIRGVNITSGIIYAIAGKRFHYGDSNSNNPLDVSFSMISSCTVLNDSTLVFDSSGIDLLFLSNGTLCYNSIYRNNTCQTAFSQGSYTERFTVLRGTIENKILLSNNNRLYSLDSTSFQLELIAGNAATSSGDNDFAKYAALFSSTGVLDKDQNILLLDSHGGRIRRIRNTDTIVEHLIGDVYQAGDSPDGIITPQTKLRAFSMEYCIKDDSIITVFDYTFKRISANFSLMETIAGFSKGYSEDGTPAVALSGDIHFFQLNSECEVFFFENCQLRKIDKEGKLSTIAGRRLQCQFDSALNSNANSATFLPNARVAINQQTNSIYIIEDYRVKKLDNGIVRAIAGIGIFRCCPAPSTKGIALQFVISVEGFGFLYSYPNAEIAIQYFSAWYVVLKNGFIELVAGVPTSKSVFNSPPPQVPSLSPLLNRFPLTVPLISSPASNRSFLLTWGAFLMELQVACYGISFDNSSVCSGNGKCVQPNICQCKFGFVGSQCEFPICFSKSRANSLILLQENFEDGQIDSEQFIQVQGGTIIENGLITNTTLQVGCGSNSGNHSLYFFGSQERMLSTQYILPARPNSFSVSFFIFFNRNRNEYPQCVNPLQNSVITLRVIEYSSTSNSIINQRITTSGEQKFTFQTSSNFSITITQTQFDARFDQWSIDDFKIETVELPCSGNGHCVGPDSCNCFVGYGGKDCSLLVIDDFDGFSSNKSTLVWQSNSTSSNFSRMEEFIIPSLNYLGTIKSIIVGTQLLFEGSVSISLQRNQKTYRLANLECNEAYFLKNEKGQCNFDAYFSAYSNTNSSTMFTIRNNNTLDVKRLIQPNEDFNKLLVEENAEWIFLLETFNNGQIKHISSAIFIENGYHLKSNLPMITPINTITCSVQNSNFSVTIAKQLFDQVQVQQWVKLVDCSGMVMKIVEKNLNGSTVQLLVQEIALEELFENFEYQMPVPLHSLQYLYTNSHSSVNSEVNKNEALEVNIPVHIVHDKISIEGHISAFLTASVNNKGKQSYRFSFSGNLNLVLSAGYGASFNLMTFKFSPIAIAYDTDKIFKFYSPELAFDINFSAPSMDLASSFTFSGSIDLGDGFNSAQGSVVLKSVSPPNVCDNSVGVSLQAKSRLLFWNAELVSGSMSIVAQLKFAAGQNTKCCGTTSTLYTLEIGISATASTILGITISRSYVYPIHSFCSTWFPVSLCGRDCKQDQHDSKLLPLPSPPARDTIPVFPPPPPRIMMGDPHITTIDGLEYSFNGIGDYLLLGEIQQTELKLKIQVRLVQLNQGSVISAIAFQYKNSSVEFYNEDLSIFVNGKQLFGLLTYQNASQLSGTDLALQFDSNLNVFQFYSIPYYLKIENKTIANVNAFMIQIIPSKEAANLVYTIPVTLYNNTQGLAGNFNHNSTDDLVNANGTLIQDLKERVIFEQFGKSWKISDQKENLFQQRTTVFDSNFVPIFGDEIQVNEHSACSHLQEFQRKQCNFDVQVTQLDSVAAIYEVTNQVVQQLDQQLLEIPRLFPNITVEFNQTSLCVTFSHLHLLMNTFSNEYGNYFISTILLVVNDNITRIGVSEIGTNFEICGLLPNFWNEISYKIQNMRGMIVDSNIRYRYKTKVIEEPPVLPSSTKPSLSNSPDIVSAAEEVGYSIFAFIWILLISAAINMG